MGGAPDGRCLLSVTYYLFSIIYILWAIPGKERNMQILDILLLAGIVLLVVLALRSMRRQRKKGSCCGCCTGCTGCTGCGQKQEK